jgi:hypothetical protein
MRTAARRDHQVERLRRGVRAAAGLLGIDKRIPFPASGQQKKFLDSFRRAAAVASFACQGRG